MWSNSRKGNYCPICYYSKPYNYVSEVSKLPVHKCTCIYRYMNALYLKSLTPNTLTTSIREVICKRRGNMRKSVHGVIHLGVATCILQTLFTECFVLCCLKNTV